ncbi:MAG: ring-cleaving dioxygenase [Longimicrobiales bacterium]
MHTTGLHHVTALSGGAQENLDFYSGVLGLRLVKRTVNFDDPGTYHLYYGDEAGSPGTIMTFFPWPQARPGREGAGMVSATSFLIPPSALNYWTERFAAEGCAFLGPSPRFDERVVSLRDPHGLPIELVASPNADALEAWADGPVPARWGLRGFGGVTLWVSDPKPTSLLLTEAFGYERIATEGDRTRFRTRGVGPPGSVIDLYHPADVQHAIPGRGTTHHVAFRAPDDEAHRRWREVIVAAGLHPTDIIDRQYFRSIYFREPNGILFEIATDEPGFSFDESRAELGTNLKLPSQHETLRAELERRLPALRLPYEPPS